MTAAPPPLRVLVVEDERPQRRLIAGWLRELAGSEVREAEHGRTALELSARHRPDIVFLDLKMPGPDGLEVARALRAIDPPPEIIFLTAYDEFRYAREAVRLGALDYLTKPVTREELASALGRAAARVRERRRRQREDRQLRHWLRRAMPALRAELAYDLLAGGRDRPELAERGPLETRARLVGLNALPTVAMCFTVDDASGPGTPGARLAEELSAACRRLEMEGRTLVSRLGGATAVVLAAVEPGGAGERAAVALAERLREAVSERQPGPVTAGVGRVVDDPRDLPQSYAGAVRARDHRWWLGSGRVIPVRDLDGFLPPPVAGLGRAEQAVVNAIRLADPAALASALAELAPLAWQAVASAPEAGAPWWPRARLVELAVVFGRAAVDAGATPDAVGRALLSAVGEPRAAAPGGLTGVGVPTRGGSGGSPGSEGAAPDEAAFTEALNALAWDALRRAEAARADRRSSSGAVRRAVAYLRRHYAEALTLEHLARQVHLSPYYFSHLFKRETGRTFVEYLTEVRLEAACRLLAETDLYVTAVAARVGYRDPNYFCRVFKRARGMTPRRYRQQAAAGR